MKESSNDDLKYMPLAIPALLLGFLLAQVTCGQVVERDLVAISIERQAAIRYLNGECFPRIQREGFVTFFAEGTIVPRKGHVLFIIERQSLSDPQAIANALASALHINQEHTHLDKGLPIPIGFRDVGDSFNDERNQEVDLLVPHIRPVRFCQ